MIKRTLLRKSYFKIPESRINSFSFPMSHYPNQPTCQGNARFNCWPLCQVYNTSPQIWPCAMAPHPKKIRLRRKFIDCLATARLPHPLCQVTARVRGATITVVVGGGEETPYFGGFPFTGSRQTQFSHSLVPAEATCFWPNSRMRREFWPPPIHWFPPN